MYRRYRERRYRRHRNSNYNDPTRRLRSTLRRPSTQIGIILVVVLIIYLILQSANQKKSQPNSLPAEISTSEAYSESQNSISFLTAHAQQEDEILFNVGFTQVTSVRAGSASYNTDIMTREEI